MSRDLPRLALKDIAHQGRTLREFDLDAALAWGHAQPDGVLLLDELAHSNAPGSRHPKRWQDVHELLAAGVEVWSTLNVQHLESLNDVVGGITGIRVAETLPDKVFDEADEVVVVDLPPDELLQRLKEGKVYLPAQAERAAKHFFRKGNLLALRELALRRTADRVDDQMQAYRRERVDQGQGAVWPNRESLLACIGSAAAGDKVVRSAARLAGQLGVVWHAVHVETARQTDDATRTRVQRLLELAQSLGARTAVLSAPGRGRGALHGGRHGPLRHARHAGLGRTPVLQDRRGGRVLRGAAGAGPGAGAEDRRWRRTCRRSRHGCRGRGAAADRRPAAARLQPLHAAQLAWRGGRLAAAGGRTGREPGRAPMTAARPADAKAGTVSPA